MAIAAADDAAGAVDLSPAAWGTLLLQQALNQYLGQSVAVDGVFASSTADAVRQYQTNKGLTVDGAVGPVTWGQIRFDSCGG